MEENRSNIVFVKVTQGVAHESCGPYVVGLMRSWSESNDLGQEYSVIGNGTTEEEALKQALVILEKGYRNLTELLKEFGSAVFDEACLNDNSDIESVERPYVYEDHEGVEKHTTVSSIWVDNNGVATWANF